MFPISKIEKAIRNSSVTHFPFCSEKFLCQSRAEYMRTEFHCKMYGRKPYLPNIDSSLTKHTQWNYTTMFSSVQISPIFGQNNTLSWSKIYRACKGLTSSNFTQSSEQSHSTVRSNDFVPVVGSNAQVEGTCSRKRLREGIVIGT